jgi:GTP-binding protein Era
MSDYKSGYVAIVGRPNVGKSTLVNALLNFKLSIITPKPQTTRTRILGIFSGEGFQVIFIDTPGIMEPKYRLQEMMVKAAKRAVAQADVVVIMVEANKDNAADADMLRSLEKSGKHLILVINKIDLASKSVLLPQIERYAQSFQTMDIIPISALKADGLEELKAALIKALPLGPPLYPEDQISEHPERFFVSEIIREKIFQHFGEEIPYSTAVVVDEFKERPQAKDYIKARIIVEKKSQKGMVIGKDGIALRQLGQDARREIESFLGREVYLELWVAVREKWRHKDAFLREYGYE